MRHRMLILGLALALLFPLLVQAQNPDNTTTPQGQLRVINALSGIGPVDVYVNSRMIRSALEPEQATAFLPLEAGQYHVAVYAQGADKLNAPVADVLIDLSAGSSKTLISYQTRFAQATATLTRQPTADDIAQAGAIYVLEDNRSPIELGKTRLTAVHLAQGSPDTLSIAYPSRASLIHELRFEQPYGDIDIDAGVYPLTLIDATTPQLPRLAFIGEQVFNANTHYTAVIIPDLSVSRAQNGEIILSELPASLRMFIVSGPIDPPIDGFQIRLIHAAANTAVLDIYMDGRLITPRMRYGQVTEYIGIKQISHTVELRPRDAAADTPPLAAAAIRITEENINQAHWTLLLLNGNDTQVPALELTQATDPIGNSTAQESFTRFNTTGGSMMLAFVPDNIAQTARNQARVRVLHAIDSALDISLWGVGDPIQPDQPQPTLEPNLTPTPPARVQLVEPAVYGAEANENEILAGQYPQLRFIAGNTTDLITLNDQWLLAGTIYTYVLIGNPSGEPPIQVLTLEDYGQGIPQGRLYLGTVSSTAGVANVRGTASNGGAVIGQVQTDSEVEVLGRNNDGQWVRIRFIPEGAAQPIEGWIFASILTVTRLGDPINVLALPLAN